MGNEASTDASSPGGAPVKSVGQNRSGNILDDLGSCVIFSLASGRSLIRGDIPLLETEPKLATAEWFNPTTKNIWSVETSYFKLESTSMMGIISSVTNTLKAVGRPLSCIQDRAGANYLAVIASDDPTQPPYLKICNLEEEKKPGGIFGTEKKEAMKQFIWQIEPIKGCPEGVVAFRDVQSDTCLKASKFAAGHPFLAKFVADDVSFWWQLVPCHMYGSNISWMADLRQYLGNRILKDVAIPGTHLSGSAPINKDTLKLGDSEFSSIWYRCQQRTIREQLEDGIRYFDFSIGKYQNNFHIYCGAAICDPLTTVLEDIKKFLTAYNMEIIILNFSGFWKFDAAAHAQLAQLIVNTFRYLLVPKDKCQWLTFNDFWKRGQNVIVFYNEPSMAGVPDFWPTEFLHHSFLATSEPLQLEAFFAKELDIRPTDRIQVNHAYCSPTDGTEFAAILPMKPQCPRDYSDVANSLVTKILVERDQAKFPTIILMDFYDKSNLIHVVRWLNQWTWITRNQRPVAVPMPIPKPQPAQPAAGQNQSSIQSQVAGAAMRNPAVREAAGNAMFSAASNPTLRNGMISAILN